MHRLPVVGLAVVWLGCSAGGDLGSPARDGASAPTPAPARGAVEDEPTMSLAELTRPYFTSDVARAASEHYAAGDYAAAREGFAAYLGAVNGDAERARVRLMIALCDGQLGRGAEVGDELVALVEALPVLADFLHYRAARAYFAARRYRQAAAQAEAVDPESAYGMSARMLIAATARLRRDWPAAAYHYARYLFDYPDGYRRLEAELRLIEALERFGGHQADVVAAYRDIAVRAPGTVSGKEARKRLKALLRRLPSRHARKLRGWSPANYIAHAMHDYRAMRNRASAKGFARALRASGHTASTLCEATYYQADSWFKERDRRQSAELFDRASEHCAEGGDPELRIKAAFQAGRSYAVVGDWPAAAARFEIAETLAAAAGSTYADDARVRQAEAWEYVGDDARGHALLAATPVLYPDGDMRGEATWRLAWRAYRQEDYRQAIGWLELQRGIKEVEHNYWAEGQAEYWLGRSYARLGDEAASLAAYEQTVRSYPLTYYALQALNRLREVAPDRFRALEAEIAAPPAGYDGGPPELRIVVGSLERNPRLARIVELMRLGLHDEVATEIARANRRSRHGGRDPVEDLDDTQAMWAVADYHHRAGRFDRSHWITRWHALDHKRSWPVGHARAKWDIAYPPGFRDLVDARAAAGSYPVALQMAIVREESGFSPGLESTANAIGLTQLIMPTARRFAGDQRVTRSTLRDPETNLAVGGNFLDYLWTHWRGNPVLVAPSYNAGEGAVRRWVGLRPWPVDEWLEAVPADQARNYAKRVLSSYFAYAYLDDGTIPVLDNEQPR